MLLSKWSISASGKFLYNNQLVEPQTFFILHLDDHKLFAEALKNCILPFFPLADIINIQDGYRALRLIKELNGDKLKLDLIITDINHPGLKGDEFLQELRILEENTKAARTAALVVSFVNEKDLPKISGPGLNIMDRHFSKNVEAVEIIEALEDILYSNNCGQDQLE